VRPQDEGISPEVVIKHAIALAVVYRLGVIPLHRQIEPGACSCREGADCDKPGKHPRIRWRERPAEPPTREEVGGWWGVWPDARVGVLLGDRFCALDVDEHDPAASGLDSLADLEATFGALPDTWRALTPSGGVHIWFELRGEVGPTTHRLRPGVQLRAGRHIMAMPPSDGREWEISPREAPLAALPAWIPQYLREANPFERSSYLPLADRIQTGSRHASYVAAARSMARAGFPLEAIVAALEVTDRTLAAAPKNDRAELESIARWALRAQIAADTAPAV
jgi:putative DNA primase/helicase